MKNKFLKTTQTDPKYFKKSSYDWGNSTAIIAGQIVIVTIVSFFGLLIFLALKAK